MPTEATGVITLSKTIPEDVNDCHIVGSNYIDSEGNWIARLGLVEPSGRRDLHLGEGSTFEFAGAMWEVSKVYEPTTATRGSVAQLTRVSEPGA